MPEEAAFGDRPLGAGPLRAVLAVDGPARLTTSEFDQQLFDQGLHVTNKDVRIDGERTTIVLGDDADRTLTVEAEAAHTSAYVLRGGSTTAPQPLANSRWAIALRRAGRILAGPVLAPTAHEITPETAPDGLPAREPGWRRAGVEQLPWQGSVALLVTFGGPGPYLMVRRHERLQVQLFEARRQGLRRRPTASGAPLGLLAIDGPVVLTARGDDATPMELGLFVEQVTFGTGDDAPVVVLSGPGNRMLTIQADPDDVRAFVAEPEPAGRSHPVGIPGA